MSIKSTLLATVAVIALFAGGAQANQAVIVNGGRPNAHVMGPKFAVIRRLQPNIHFIRPPSFPPTWTFSYKYNGSTYQEAFVGKNPSGGASTTVPVWMVPIKMVYGSVSYNPESVKVNGVNIDQNIINSPIFQKSVDYVQGGTNLGTTQYEDAFQRGALWGTVKSHTGYHVLLTSPHVTPLQTYNIPQGRGGLQGNLIVAEINAFDGFIQPLISKLGIPSTALPLFITTQTYLYSGSSTSGCCIGGYHSVTNSNGQPYSYATYITSKGAFAQDVSALSHELGEWIDDPYVNNNSPCGIYEVGDPLEGNTNYGGYPYTVNGVTWNLQDLVLPPYFGAPTSTSVNGWSTFQGESLAVCQNGS